MNVVRLIISLLHRSCRNVYEVRSKFNCVYCFRAMALLLVMGLPFKKVSFESEADKQSMRDAGLKKWPMIYKDGKYIGGYSDLLLKLTGSERF